MIVAAEDTIVKLPTSDDTQTAIDAVRKKVPAYKVLDVNND